MPVSNRFLPFLPWSFLCTLFLGACHPFPESPDGPYFSLSSDTSVLFNRLIIPGDTVEYVFSVASRTENNTLWLKAMPHPVQPFEFLGPDSDLVVEMKIPISGKKVNAARRSLPIPSGIRPGLYRFSARTQDASGAFSDSSQFTYFIDVPAYPLLILDTPLNGFLANHVIQSQDFDLRMRAYGNRLEGLSLQWFDSLKVQALLPPEDTLIPSGQTEFILRRRLGFPAKSGKQFYLRAILRTLDGRQTLWWIPFERRLT